MEVEKEEEEEVVVVIAGWCLSVDIQYKVPLKYMHIGYRAVSICGHGARNSPLNSLQTPTN